MATKTWSGNSAGSINWSDSANWDSVPVAGDYLYFNCQYSWQHHTSNNDFPTDTTFLGVRFGTDNHTIGGNRYVNNSGGYRNNDGTTSVQTVNLDTKLKVGATFYSGLSGTAEINQLIINGQVISDATVAGGANIGLNCAGSWPNGQIVFNANNSSFKGICGSSQGVVVINGSFPRQPLELKSLFYGGVIGTGTFLNKIQTNPYNTVYPPYIQGGAGGTAIGTLNTGEVFFDYTHYDTNPPYSRYIPAEYRVNLNGATSTCSKINSDSTVTCDGLLKINSYINPATDKTFVVIQAAAVVGHFEGMINGTVFNQGGHTFKINYSSTQVTLLTIQNYSQIIVSNM